MHAMLVHRTCMCRQHTMIYARARDIDQRTLRFPTEGHGHVGRITPVPSHSRPVPSPSHSRSLTDAGPTLSSTQIMHAPSRPHRSCMRPMSTQIMHAPSRPNRSCMRPTSTQIMHAPPMTHACHAPPPHPAGRRVGRGLSPRRRVWRLRTAETRGWFRPAVTPRYGCDPPFFITRSMPYTFPALDRRVERMSGFPWGGTPDLAHASTLLIHPSSLSPLSPPNQHPAAAAVSERSARSSSSSSSSSRGANLP